MLDTRAKRSVGCGDGCGGFLVKIFDEFTPEGIRHELGSGLSTEIFDNEFEIELNALESLVIVYVWLFQFGGGGLARLSCRFLLDFEPGVDIVGKEAFFSLLLGKIPPFVDLKKGVPLFHGFLNFRGAPGSSESSRV